MSTLNYSKAKRAARWFDVRGRRSGMWAYALNRLTGIGLVIYLYLHLGVLSTLIRANQRGIRLWRQRVPHSIWRSM